MELPCDGVADVDVLSHEIGQECPTWIDNRWATRTLLRYRLMERYELLYDRLVTAACDGTVPLDSRCFVRASFSSSVHRSP